MKSLYNIIEGLLDSDFDVKDSDIFTLKELGYRCTNMSANDNWGRGVSDFNCYKLTKVETSQANRNGFNPYNGLDEYVNTMVFHNKVSAGRDGMGFGKWKFAWIIRFVLDYCHADADDIKQFITKCMTDKIANSLRVDVKIRGNKIFIKSSFRGTWGPANMSMTLAKV